MYSVEWLWCFCSTFQSNISSRNFLKCTDTSKAVCIFLDLRILVFCWQIWYTSEFADNSETSVMTSDLIVKYPDLSGNIPLKPSYYKWVRHRQFNISNISNISKRVLLAETHSSTENWILYSVYISQLVRYCDINQSSSGFVSDVKDMTWCFLNKGVIFKTVQELALPLGKIWVRCFN